MARILTLIASLAAALVLTGSAAAAGGTYVFDGGSGAQRNQVRAALDASTFNWSLVPAQITIHIASGTDSEATQGNIWIDADLLAAGKFGWAVIQHEYAHQVDFFLLSDVQRAFAAPMLGGKAWSPTPGVSIAHGQLTAERFASTLTWAYWSSRDNSLRPQSATDESAAMPPAQFRALLVSLLGSGAAPTGAATATAATPRSLSAARRR